jgi:hypothetical protein
MRPAWRSVLMDLGLLTAYYFNRSVNLAYGKQV